jgi:hypothetical protein
MRALTPAGPCGTEREAVHQFSHAQPPDRCPDLLLEHFFDLSDFFLNFAGVFFGVAFGL